MSLVEKIKHLRGKKEEPEPEPEEEKEEPKPCESLQWVLGLYGLDGIAWLSLCLPR